jgi:hypothetical protein
VIEVRRGSVARRGGGDLRRSDIWEGVVDEERGNKSSPAEESSTSDVLNPNVGTV